MFVGMILLNTLNDRFRSAWSQLHPPPTVYAISCRPAVVLSIKQRTDDCSSCDYTQQLSQSASRWQRGGAIAQVSIADAGFLLESGVPQVKCSPSNRSRRSCLQRRENNWLKLIIGSTSQDESAFPLSIGTFASHGWTDGTRSKTMSSTLPIVRLPFDVISLRAACEAL